jgi:O-antigen/teichoic acid export membrane protein
MGPVEKTPPLAPGDEVVSEGTPPDLIDTPAAGGAAIRGSAIRAGGFVLVIGMSLASIPLLVRHLGVVDFGRYATVLSVVTIATGATEAGLTQIGVREFSLRSPAERDRLMRNLLGIRVTLTAAAVLLATGFSALAGYGGTLVLGTFLAGIGALLLATQNTIAVPLNATLRLGWVTAAEVIKQFLTVIAIVGLVVAGAGLLPFLAATIPSTLIMLGLTVLVVRGLMPLRPAFERSEWASIARDILPFAAATAISFAYFRLTMVLMSLISTATQTGYFAASFRVIETVVTIPYLLVSAAFPVLARAASDDLGRLRYALQKLSEVGLLVGLWISLAIFVGAPFVIDVIAGSKFKPAVDVLRIQSFAVTATFLAIAFQFGLLALRRHNALLIANGCALALSAAMAAILIPGHGAKGAAIATVAGELALALSAGILFVRSRADLGLEPATMPRIVAAAAAALALALAVPGLGDVPRVVLFTVAYFGALVAVRAFPLEVVAAIRAR